MMEDDETEYMKKGWDNNVRNCNIDLERSIMVSDEKYSPEYDVIKAGVILGNLLIEQDQYTLCKCGKWSWLEFKDKEIAMAFKLLWE